MKKIVSILLSLVMLLSISSAAGVNAYAKALTKGKCGKSVTYSFQQSTGTLTISGKGKMTNYAQKGPSSPFESKSGIKKVIIKKGVTNIGGAMFFDCKNLSSVTVPETVKEIQNAAFHGCKSLNSIKLPSKIKAIGMEAFSGTSYLSNAANYSPANGVKNGVLYNGKYLIKVSSKVSGTFKVRKGTVLMAAEAFSGCKSLTKIKLPDGIKNISDMALFNCKSLKSINIPKSVKTIGLSAFWNCRKLGSIKLSNSVKKIEGYAFENCSSLKEVRLPKNTKTIPYGLFYKCSKLKSVKLPSGVEKIEGEAFHGCKKLKTLKLPEKLKTLSGYTFSGCTSLKSINIPKGIKYIDDQTFEHCKSLKKITIPSNIKRIAPTAFRGCTNLVSITYKGTCNNWNKINKDGVNSSFDKAELICDDVVFPAFLGEIKKAGQIYEGNDCIYKWKATNVSDIEGYQVRYCENYDFGEEYDVQYDLIDKNQNKYKISNIDDDKWCYVQIRFYMIKDGKTRCGSWVNID